MVESHGREIEISNLNHKEKPKRNTRRGFSCLRAAGSYVRDWRKRRRYATRADRLVLRQSVRRIESMAPSASLILLTLRFDRQVTASSANADRATKHFRYQKPFFKQIGCHKMAFSQRARAYTLNPTLPCPTLPLSPRALSDSSIIPAAGRLCLKLNKASLESTFV